MTVCSEDPLPGAVAPRLFVVDDEPAVVDFVGHFAGAHGFDVCRFLDATKALAQLTKEPPDLALIDLRMPSVGGLSVLQEIKRRAPLCEVVLMTGYGSIESAVEAVKLGATDYLRKPLDLARLTDLLVAVHREVQRRRKVEAIEADLIEHVRFHGIVGNSPAMLELFSLIRRIAPHFSTALVTGETGTGKELVARALHALSRRRAYPFVTVNCAAIVDTLVESELFGHTKGAFTGATLARAGLFERAHGGIVFLDEVGELPYSAQSKLLRVLESGEIAKVGSNRFERVDVLVIAATNRDLAREVDEGRFRADLYYRLHVVKLSIPPLRQRREDIPLLTRAFVDEFARQFGKPVRGLTPEAEQVLMSHAWPGNVRELRNVLERACMLSETEVVDARGIVVDPTSTGGRQVSHAIEARQPDGIERNEIMRVLDDTRGNKNEAARRLGLSRRALYRRLDKFGLRAASKPN